MKFAAMNEAVAREIAVWTYPPPYGIYSMEGSDDCVAEFLNGDYYYAQDESGKIVGFVCGGQSARVAGGYGAGIYNDPDRLDIGLGLRPDLTGVGRGSGFLQEALRFMGDTLNFSKFQLVVAAFNERAVKAYAKAGFQPKVTFYSTVAGQPVLFLSMRCPD